MARQLKRQDEEFAREALNRLLIQHGEKKNIKWIPHERPDWLVSIEGEKIGVEVTWVSPSVRLGGRSYPSRGVAATMVRWLESLAESLQDEGLVNGLYIVSMRPFVEFQEKSPDLRAAITSYIDQTESVEVAPDQRLPGNWRIRKRGLRPNLLSYTYSLRQGGWEVDIRKRIKHLIYEAVERKEKLLGGLEIPTVLALVDDYHFADAEMWAEAAEDIPTSAESIVRVHGNYRCQVLTGTEFLHGQGAANHTE